MELLKDILFTLFHPSFWMMNEPYSAEWDKTFKSLLERHFFTDTGNHVTQLGNLTLWIGNYPYACFTIYPEQFPHVRPARRTIYRAYKKLIHDSINQKVVTAAVRGR